AFNIGGTGNLAEGIGVGNTAINVFGNDNDVIASGGTGLTNPSLSLAFNFGGSKNIILANGPLAVAGGLGVDNHNGVGTNPPPITQTGPGVNIKTPLNP